MMNTYRNTLDYLIFITQMRKRKRMKRLREENKVANQLNLLNIHFTERGKRRFEEDFDFANEEFFTSWKSRTKAGSKPDSNG